MAIIDINVNGVTSLPLAAIWQDRSVPFIFVTGYGAQGLVDGYQDAQVLTKSYELDDLSQVVAKARAAAD